MLIIFQPPSPDHGPGLQKCIENLAVEKFVHKLAVERFHTSVFPEATGHVGEGLKGLLKEGGSSRRAAVEKIINSMGASWKLFTMPSERPTFTPLLICPTMSMWQRLPLQLLLVEPSP